MKKNEIALWGHRFVDDDIEKAYAFLPFVDGDEVEVQLVDRDGFVFKLLKEIKDGNKK